MHGAELNSLHIERAGAAEREEAIALALAHLSAEDRPRHAAAWADSIAASQADLWVGRRGGRLTAAMLAQIQPGRTANILPPHVVHGESCEAASAILTHCAGDLGRRGVRLAQALLETDHGDDMETLMAAGFRHAADLQFLVSVAGSFPTETPQDDLQFVSYCDAEHKRLTTIIEQTYEGSLDCPQIDRVRDVGDVLAGYRAVGEFDPARWLVVRHGGNDVGCLLLADHPRSDAWELVYMGVVPAARGRGFGLALCRTAQWMTACAGRERLTAAVDAANAPAIAAYAAAGFVTWDARSVFLRVF